MKEWIRDIVLALIIGFLLIQFVKPTIVKEHSMLPTLNENNYLFCSRQAYTLFGDPERGDIIVFHSGLELPNGQEKLLIKRVIGLPGETVDIVGGVVYIDGQPLQEDYTLDGWTSGSIEGLVVPDGQVFAMGDNRQNSMDSRSPEIGCVKIENIMGKAVFRLYPFSHIGGLYGDLQY